MNKNVEIKSLKSRFQCNLCNYSSGVSTNLHAHYKSKRHIDEVINTFKKKDKVCIGLLKLQRNVLSIFKQYKKNNFVKEVDYKKILGINDMDNNNLTNIIVKDIEESKYICTGCSEIFERKLDYKVHTNECLQIENKYNIMQSLAIDLGTQLKELLEIYSKLVEETNHKSIKISPTTYKNQIEELQKSNIDLNQQLSLMKSDKERLEKKIIKINTKFDHMKNKYTNIKDKYNESSLKISELNVKNQIFHEMIEKHREQQDNFTKINYNNIVNNVVNNVNVNTVLNGVLGNNPIFKYENVFVNPETELPYGEPSFLEEQILKDNKNASNKHKSMLCNGSWFYHSYNDNESEKDKEKALIQRVARETVHTYKKRDPRDQSIWCTDASRSKFRIRLEDKDTQVICWYKEKIKIFIHFINPIAKYIGEALLYFKYYCAQKYLTNKEEYIYPISKEDAIIFNKFMSITEGTELSEIEISGMSANRLKYLFNSITNLIEIVTNRNFGDKLLKEMAENFYLDPILIMANFNKKAIQENKELTQENKELIQEYNKN